MHPRAEVLAILGSGNQAVSHYNVFTDMFSFKEVKAPAWTGYCSILMDFASLYFLFKFLIILLQSIFF